MNIKISDNWLREYLKTEASPVDIAKLLSLCGPNVEYLVKAGEDYVYDIEITTNRVDQFSVLGIAREAAAILNNNGFKAEFIQPKIILPKIERNFVNLEISDKNNLVKRILAVVLTGVKVGESPTFIKDRLTKAGVRPLNNLVDITNYVMLEFGQPTHVFDLDRVKTNKLILRNAKKGEEIETLDRKKYLLNSEDVVIDDGTGKIIDLPGISGTSNSVVNKQTTRLIFFTELNYPLKIRRTSMTHGIRTLASTYNENEPDAVTAQNAFYRGIELFKQIVKATPTSQVYDINKQEQKEKLIGITVEDITNYINTKLEKAKIIGILKDLGFSYRQEKNNELIFAVPAYRQKDINIKQDIVEEVARIYGYHNIKSVLPPFSYTSDPYIRAFSEKIEVEKTVKQFLSNIGFFEMYNYSMISKKLSETYGFKDSLCMINPMTVDLACFRQSLVPSLILNAKVNSQEKDLAIFELANIYLPKKDSLPNEKSTLSLLYQNNYFNLKGIFEALLHLGYIENVSYKNCQKYNFLEKDRAVEIYIDNKYLGFLGEVSKKVQHQLGIMKNLSVLELDFNLLTKYFQTQTPLSPGSKTTPIIEDITYKQSSKYNWLEVTTRLKKEFKDILKIEYLNKYENYISMRVYTVSNESILAKITAFLEQDLSIVTKRLKDDKNK